MRARLLAPLVFAGIAIAGAPRADDADQAHRDAVAAKVGSQVITVGEVEAAMARVPKFQLAALGGTSADAKRAYIENVIVPDALLAQAAKDKHLEDTEPTRSRISRALSTATLRALSKQSAQEISNEEVLQYYQDNKSKFDTPERIQVWRILCKSREEASAVIDAAKADGTPKTFGDLARQHSADTATAMRSGNLGFLAPDGSSNEAGVKVDPGVVVAAAKVKDGEIVSQPVPEGTYFSVVWRRGSIAANHRKVEEVSPQIRDALRHDRAEQTRKDLVESLRAKNVSDVNGDLLGMIEVSRADGAITPRKRPGQVPPIHAQPPGAQQGPPNTPNPMLQPPVIPPASTK